MRNKIKQLFQDVTLPDLVRALEVLTSMMRTIDQEVNRVFVVHEQGAGLAQKWNCRKSRLLYIREFSKRFVCKTKPRSERRDMPPPDDACLSAEGAGFSVSVAPGNRERKRSLSRLNPCLTQAMLQAS